LLKTDEHQQGSLEVAVADLFIEEIHNGARRLGVVRSALPGLRSFSDLVILAAIVTMIRFVPTNGKPIRLVTRLAARLRFKAVSSGCLRRFPKPISNQILT
jgi:hypothetical protein